MIDVLVVDDDFMVARIHCGYVSRLEGFRVVGEAHTGAEAVAAVRELQPHLVLLDVHLPDRSGLDVLRELRSDAALSTDVVVITEDRDLETVRAALHGGVASYLVKPFTFATFAERLARYAEARAQVDHVGELAQDDVDRVFAVVRRPGTVVLPKGLSGTTCRLVVEVLQAADGDLSAARRPSGSASRGSARGATWSTCPRRVRCRSGRATAAPSTATAGARRPDSAVVRRERRSRSVQDRGQVWRVPRAGQPPGPPMILSPSEDRGRYRWGAST